MYKAGKHMQMSHLGASAFIGWSRYPDSAFFGFIRTLPYNTYYRITRILHGFLLDSVLYIEIIRTQLYIERLSGLCLVHGYSNIHLEFFWTLYFTW
jgi:hypothetical protein